MRPFDLMDEMTAEALEMSTEDYVRKIETISENRMEVIIESALSGRKDRIEKAKQIMSQIPS